MYHPFSITETLSIAWHILKKNFATIAVYTFVAILIFGVTFFIANNIIDDAVLAYPGLIVTIFIVSFVVLGFIKLIFQLIDKEYYDFEFKDILPKIKMLMSYIVLFVLVTTIALFVRNSIKNLEEGLIQSILGIFTGIIIEIFFLFYFPICACFIVDEYSGPFESVMQTYNLIKDNFLKYFILFLIIEAIFFICSITVIGIVFVVPFVYIILVVAYRKLVYSYIDADDELNEAL